MKEIKSISTKYFLKIIILKNNHMSNSRRQFLSDTSKIIAATGMSGFVPAAASFASPKIPPGDKIALGLIGVRP